MVKVTLRNPNDAEIYFEQSPQGIVPVIHVLPCSNLIDALPARASFWIETEDPKHICFGHALYEDPDLSIKVPAGKNGKSWAYRLPPLAVSIDDLGGDCRHYTKLRCGDNPSDYYFEAPREIVSAYLEMLDAKAAEDVAERSIPVPEPAPIPKPKPVVATRKQTPMPDPAPPKKLPEDVKRDLPLLVHLINICAQEFDTTPEFVIGDHANARLARLTAIFIACSCSDITMAATERYFKLKGSMSTRALEAFDREVLKKAKIKPIYERCRDRFDAREKAIA